jgi:hypothetical protein
MECGRRANSTNLLSTSSSHLHTSNLCFHIFSPLHWNFRVVTRLPRRHEIDMLAVFPQCVAGKYSAALGAASAATCTPVRSLNVIFLIFIDRYVIYSHWLS